MDVSRAAQQARRVGADSALQPFESWTHEVNSSFVPLSTRAADPDSRERFRGSLLSASVGQAGMSIVGGGSVSVLRQRRDIARADPGHVKLGLQLRGHGVITQRGREAELRPGDFALYDTAEPYDLRFEEPFRMFVVMLPRETMPQGGRRLHDVTAQRFGAENGMGRVMSSFLRSLSEQLESDDLEAGVGVSDAVVDLLSATTAQRFGGAAPEPEVGRHALRLQIESWTAERLGQPGLSVSAIAEAHHVSVRLVQKLFAEDGDTLSAWIRERRLERARRELFDPALFHQTIAQTALHCGFADATAFGRAYRQRYGCSPSETRAASVRDR